MYTIFNSSCYFCNILCVCILEFRNITELHVQRNDHLASLVIHMEKEYVLSQPTRDIISTIIHSPINSKDKIKLSWDTPLNNQKCLNILRPTVLKQCYGANIDDIHLSSELIRRYTYGYGSGTSSVVWTHILLSRVK